MAIELDGLVVQGAFPKRKQSIVMDSIESNLHQLEIGAAKYSEDMQRLVADARKEFSELRKMVE